MTTLADGTPQFTNKEAGNLFIHPQYQKDANELLQAWSKERKCVNCKYFNKETDRELDSCRELEIPIAETFHCAAWERK